MLFNNELPSLQIKVEIQDMTKKSKKEKSAGREEHRQKLRAKKMKTKERKKVGLPTRHKK